MLKSPIRWPVPKRASAGTALPIPPGLLQKGEEQTEWCWAACVQLVVGYRDPAHPKQQCELANAVLRLGGNCCAAPEPCNDGLEVQEVDKLFHDVKILSQRVGTALSAQVLKVQLDALRPVGIGLNWGHMVLVHGWKPGQGADQFLVYDPIGPADGTLSHADLVDYGGAGAWATSWENL
jgi:hypothetical protein